MKFLIVCFLAMIIGAEAAPPKSSKNFFKDKTAIENPFNLRDPFKAPQLKSEGKREGRGFSVTGKGQYSNIGEADLSQVNVSNIKVVGVLIGKERRAMISVEGGLQSSSGSKSSAKVIVLKEGAKLGSEGAELKAILPGGIVLVEKIVNVYGEEEYLETVIPISR